MTQVRGYTTRSGKRVGAYARNGSLSMSHVPARNRRQVWEIGMSKVGRIHRVDKTIHVKARGQLEAERRAERLYRRSHRGAYHTVHARPTGLKSLSTPSKREYHSKLEGPFRYRSGWEGMYDPKEGRYYDHKSDLYMPRNFDPHEGR